MVYLDYAKVVFEDNRKAIISMLDSDWFRENWHKLFLHAFDNYPRLNPRDPGELYDKFIDEDYEGMIGWYMAKELNNNFLYFFKESVNFVYALDHQSLSDASFYFLNTNREIRGVILMFKDFAFQYIGKSYWPHLEEQPNIEEKVRVFELYETDLAMKKWLENWMRYNINCSFNYDFHTELNLK